MRTHWTATQRTTGALIATVAVVVGVWLSAQLSGQGMAAVLAALENVYNQVVLALSDPWALLGAAQSWLQDQYQRAPTLVLGLIALVSFPVIAVVSAIIRALKNTEDGGETTARASRARSLQARLQARDAPDFITRPKRAIVEIPDPIGRGRSMRFPLSQPVVQIGRSEDVDIVINDPTVHRHHAAIHCTEDANYLVTDLSAGTGNGVTVNGEPVLQRKICNGDVIRLGRAKLKFLTSTA